MKSLGRFLLGHPSNNQMFNPDHHLRWVTDSVPALIVYVDTQLIFRFVNKTYQKWYNRPSSEILGQPLIKVVGEKNLARLQPYIDKALGGESVSFDGDFEVFDKTIRAFHADYVPHFDQKNKVCGVVALINDTTESKKEETRNQVLVDLSQILSSSHDVEMILDKVSGLMVQNLAECCMIHLLKENRQLTLSGLSGTAALPLTTVSPLLKRFPFDFADVHGPGLAIRNGNPLLLSHPSVNEVLWNTQSPELGECIKRLKISSVMYIPLSARNQVLGCLSIWNTTAERQMTEEDLRFLMDVARRVALTVDNVLLFHEAQTANRAKDEFLATLSHELRTPMNVIMGWLEILDTEELDEESFDQAMATLRRNAQVQIQLINDLLDTSRIISGKISLNVQTTDLGLLALAGIDSIQPALRAKGITISHEVAKGKRLEFQGDPGRIQQVLWNLLSNAVKFTPSGGKIHLQIEANEKALTLHLTDSGCGIDPRFLTFVFDRFRQEENGSTRAQGGLGLGLSIVRYLVELHGGTVSAHSEGRDQGTRFTVVLPRRSPLPLL